ncbi:hypothetical protein GS501_00620 [Saccharibacter sp. 17.LH.SD]|nr:hypothetical protein [Saccharibacter sp. 17.LH.SD]
MFCVSFINPAYFLFAQWAISHPGSLLIAEQKRDFEVVLAEFGYSWAEDILLISSSEDDLSSPEGFEHWKKLHHVQCSAEERLKMWPGLYVLYVGPRFSCSIFKTVSEDT